MSKNKTAAATDRPAISREDIEHKIRAFTGDVNETTEKMTKASVAVGAGLLVALLIIVFLIGRGKGVKKTTVVEIVRV
ncbi:MAG: hypothetical protein ACKVHU_17740 [Acidimicrobiales bacterium]|jgi:hypothetical protein